MRLDPRAERYPSADQVDRCAHRVGERGGRVGCPIAPPAGEQRCRAGEEQGAAHRAFGVTVKMPPSLRPLTPGLYISSACVGGRTNTPGVVARATYVVVYVPGHSVVATNTTRSSRNSRRSNGD